MPDSAVLAILVPPDARDVSSWTHDLELAQRRFAGAVREVFGFAVRVEGVQRENGTCTRQVLVVATSPQTRLEPEAVRQLSAALSAAVDEIEALA